MPQPAPGPQAAAGEPLVRRALPALIFGCVLAVTLGLVAWSIHYNALERRRLTERGVVTLRLQLQSVLRSYLDILPGLRLAASGPVPLNDAEFERYGQTVLGPDRFPGLAITFVAERVNDGQRDAFVRRVADDRSLQPQGRPGFDISPPGRRPEHMVLRHQAPPDPATDGYDLYDPGQNYRPAVARAIDTGRLTATPPLQLARDRLQPKQPALTSIVVRAATYRGAGVPDGLAARQQTCTGVVGIGFRTREVIHSALPPELLANHRVRVVDRQAPPGAAPLYDNNLQADTQSAPLAFDLPVADRHWQVTVAPLHQPWWSNADASTLALLMAGLISAASLSALTGGLSRARRQAEARVREGLAHLEHEKAQLARSETRLRMLFEHSFDAILNTRPDGRILAANPAACALFGYSEADICALGRDGLIDREDPRLQPLLETRAAYGRARGTISMRRSDGSLFEGEISSMQYRDIDGDTLASLIVRDVSPQLAAAAERERLEAQLRHAQKMEAVGTLAGGIAHDFNNLLAVMLGGAALLADAPGLTDLERAQLGRMRQAGQRGRNLVQQLLTFSRPSTPGRRPQPLQPLVEESLSLLSLTLPATVRLERKLQAAPLLVDTEATQIQQIVINLCNNAWQAMPGQKGHIVVSLDAAQAEGRNWVRLGVRDDGAGMDAATRERIFEPFFSTKSPGQGTGLGLSMVHGIVSAHGGHIELNSAPGQGSEFLIWLPQASAPLESGAATDAAEAARCVPAPGAGRRLLYLDDDEVLRLTVGALLQRAGYEVELHADPAAALAALRARPQAYAGLLSDYNMPQMTGLDVLRALRAEGSRVPVLLMSGQLPDEVRDALAGMPAVALLPKEFLAEQLAQAVGELLAQAA